MMKKIGGSRPSSITGRGLGIQVDPGNDEPILKSICGGYSCYDPKMLKNHEEYCNRCREKREAK